MPAFPPGASAKGGQAAIQTNVESARAFYAPILPVVAELHRQGLSLRQIARELDRRGVKTRFEYPGQRWSATQVRRVLARIAAEGGAPQAAKTGSSPEPAGAPQASKSQSAPAEVPNPLGHRSNS
jgi:hypothetical protein